MKLYKPKSRLWRSQPLLKPIYSAVTPIPIEILCRIDILEEETKTKKSRAPPKTPTAPTMIESIEKIYHP